MNPINTPDDISDLGNARQSPDFVSWIGATGYVNIAIVFTDIIDSTRLINEIGDAPWSEIRNAHFKQAQSLINKHNGYLIKKNGDGLFAVTRNSVDALRFALEFEANPGNSAIRIRAGVHIGQVEVNEGDAFGREVNLAYRIMSKAEHGGIWLSSRVHDDWLQHNRDNSLPWTRHDNVKLRSFQELFTLWSLPSSKDPLSLPKMDSEFSISDIQRQLLSAPDQSQLLGLLYRTEELPSTPETRVLSDKIKRALALEQAESPDMTVPCIEIEFSPLLHHVDYEETTHRAILPTSRQEKCDPFANWPAIKIASPNR